MAILDSLEELSKSKLFDRQGQAIDQTVRVMGTAGEQIAATATLENTIVDQKYRIVSLLGAGGMGAVYKAHHLLLDKEVALKTFKSPNLTDDNWQRFQREAKAISRLAHNNIVQVFDFGFGENNVPYYTMECLIGQSLADRLATNGPLPLDQAIPIFLQICDGLTLAHSKGIIHRDLKPANIFLASTGGIAASPMIVKIVDFGLADLVINAAEEQKLTAAGTIFGSPLYMSPEQSLGLKINERSDIYSLGCALFETITGVPPFRGENAFATMLKHQEADIPHVNEFAAGKNFPQRVQGLLAKMLAKNPNRRFQTLTEVSTELKQILAIYNSSGMREAGKLKAKKTGEAEAHADNFTATKEEGKRPNSDPIPVRKLIIIVFAFGVLTTAALALFSSLHKKPESQALQGPIRVRTFPSTTSKSKPDTIGRYLQNPDAPSGQDHVFVFPSDKSLGKLTFYYLVNGHNFEKSTSAKGRVQCPSISLIGLEANQVMAKDPKLIYGFDPADLFTLQLAKDCDWGDEHMQYVSRLTGIKTLNISDSDISDKSMPYLNKLIRLEAFYCENAKVSGEGLVSLYRLKQLKFLDVSHMSNFSACLPTLAHSTCLQDLKIDSCDIKDSDMKHIASLINLKSLNIAENPKVTNHALVSISHMKELATLDISGTSININGEELLKRVPKLKHLIIDSNEWSEADKKRLSKVLKGVTIDPAKLKFRSNAENLIDEEGFSKSP